MDIAPPIPDWYTQASMQNEPGSALITELHFQKTTVSLMMYWMTI